MISKALVAASAKPIILALLMSGENYGYQILKRVSQVSGGKLDWSEALLYPVLHRLEKDGLVVCAVEDLRRQPPAQVLPAHRGRAKRTADGKGTLAQRAQCAAALVGTGMKKAGRRPRGRKDPEKTLFFFSGLRPPVCGLRSPYMR